MFKAGDKAIKVRSPHYTNIKKYDIVEINKVYEDGHLIIRGSRKHWRHRKSRHDEPNYFTRHSEYGGGDERLYVYSEENLCKFRRQKYRQSNRLLLNKLGKKFINITDNEQGARLWDSLPNEFKKLLKDEKQVS